MGSRKGEAGGRVGQLRLAGLAVNSIRRPHARLRASELRSVKAYNKHQPTLATTTTPAVSPPPPPPQPPRHSLPFLYHHHRRISCQELATAPSNYPSRTLLLPACSSTPDHGFLPLSLEARRELSRVLPHHETSAKHSTRYTRALTTRTPWRAKGHRWPVCHTQ